jgi:acetyltransferase-like isoleucine patch superfamily enzyme
VTFGGSVTVGEDVWIGLGASIMNGITIGNYALIGIGAVILKDVAPGAVMVGNPAKAIRTRIKKLLKDLEYGFFDAV